MGAALGVFKAAALRRFSQAGMAAIASGRSHAIDWLPLAVMCNGSGGSSRQRKCHNGPVLNWTCDSTCQQQWKMMGLIRLQ
jgi:hypothetical protein